MKILKFLIVVLAIGIAVFLLRDEIEKRKFVTMENEAIDLFNDERYEEAAQKYLILFEKIKSEDKERIKNQIVKCYKLLGDNPSLPLKKQIEFYKKAMEYDQNCITDKNMLRFIKEYK